MVDFACSPALLATSRFYPYDMIHRGEYPIDRVYRPGYCEALVDLPHGACPGWNYRPWAPPPPRGQSGNIPYRHHPDYAKYVCPPTPRDMVTPKDVPPGRSYGGQAVGVVVPGGDPFGLSPVQTTMPGSDPFGLSPVQNATPGRDPSGGAPPGKVYPGSDPFGGAPFGGTPPSHVYPGSDPWGGTPYGGAPPSNVYPGSDPSAQANGDTPTLLGTLGCGVRKKCNPAYSPRYRSLRNTLRRQYHDWAYSRAMARLTSTQAHCAHPVISGMFAGRAPNGQLSQTFEEGLGETQHLTRLPTLPAMTIDRDVYFPKDVDQAAQKTNEKDEGLSGLAIVALVVAGGVGLYAASKAFK